MGQLKSEKRAEFIVVKITRFSSIRIANIISKYNISPNQITIMSFFLQVMAAISYSIGNYFYNLIGTSLYLFGFLFDFVDGDLARIKKKTSLFGEWMDAVLGKAGTVLVLLGISFGALNAHPPNLVLLFCLVNIASYYLVHGLRYKNLIIELKYKLINADEMGEPKMIISTAKNVYLFKKVIRELFCGELSLVYFLIIFAFFNKMYWFLIYSSVFMILTYFVELFFSFKKNSFLYYDKKS